MNETEKQMQVFLLIQENGSNVSSEVIGAFRDLQKALAERDFCRQRDTVGDRFEVKVMDLE